MHRQGNANHKHTEKRRRQDCIIVICPPSPPSCPPARKVLLQQSWRCFKLPPSLLHSPPPKISGLMWGGDSREAPLESCVCVFLLKSRSRCSCARRERLAAGGGRGGSFSLARFFPPAGRACCCKLDWRRLSPMSLCWGKQPIGGAAIGEI